MSVKVCEYCEQPEEKKDETDDETTSAEKAPEPPELETVDSRDLSITGIALMTKREYKANEQYLLKLHIDDGRGKMQEFPICARVMRIAPWRDTKFYRVGLQFLGMPKKMNEQLSRFVLVEQQKDIKNKRRFK